MALMIISLLSSSITAVTTPGASSLAGSSSLTGGGDAKKAGGGENSTVNVLNQDGAMDSKPTLGALVEVVKRDKLYRTISETMSEMHDKMKQMMENITNRLDQIESAGNSFRYIFTYSPPLFL